MKNAKKQAIDWWQYYITVLELLLDFFAKKIISNKLKKENLL